MVSRKRSGHFFSGGCDLALIAMRNLVERSAKLRTAGFAGISSVVLHLGVLNAALVLALGWGWSPAQARTWHNADAPITTPSAGEVALSDLPRAGREVFQRIQNGGPFDYDKDGTVFGNRERQLPRQQRGFYREYTVPTPGSRDRGARRIVCGGKAARQPETCFYTQDHYRSFQRIDPSR